MNYCHNENSYFFKTKHLISLEIAFTIQHLAVAFLIKHLMERVQIQVGQLYLGNFLILILRVFLQKQQQVLGINLKLKHKVSHALVY